MERALEPELLDELPPDDPRAIRSRRDLKWLNWWMGHRSILAHALMRYWKNKPLRRIVDLGAGDGVFALGLARELVKYQPRLQVVLLDQQPAVSEQVKAQLVGLGCTVETVAADIFDWLNQGQGTAQPGTVFTANLFLHHFHEAELCEMFYLASRQVDLFTACEPSRNGLSLTAAKWVGLIGCGPVTRHDAVVSVRAGFIKRELSEMWPEAGNWMLQEQRAGMFSHLFVAHRK